MRAAIQPKTEDTADITDLLTSIVLSGHVKTGTVDNMSGAIGTVTGKHGEMTIVAAETGREASVGATVGAREPIGRIVETVALDGKARSGCPTDRADQEKPPLAKGRLLNRRCRQAEGQGSLDAELGLLLMKHLLVDQRPSVLRIPPMHDRQILPLYPSIRDVSDLRNCLHGFIKM